MCQDYIQKIRQHHSFKRVTANLLNSVVTSNASCEMFGYNVYSKKSFNCLERLGWRNLRNAFASI